MVITPMFENFRQGDFIQYVNNVLQIITKGRATQLQVAAHREKLVAVMEQLNSAWLPGAGSPITPEIQELDSLRDRCFTGLKLTVENWSGNHYDAAMREAAFALSDNIAGHGDRITSMRYQQQTATLNAVIEDLGNELADKVNTLGLVSWVTELKRLNMAFDRKYVERAKSLSGYDPGLIVELIDAATRDFRNLKTIFEARYSVALADETADVPEFRQAADEWSSLSRQYNMAVTRNAANGGSNEEDSSSGGGNAAPPQVVEPE